MRVRSSFINCEAEPVTGSPNLVDLMRLEWSRGALLWSTPGGEMRAGVSLGAAITLTAIVFVAGCSTSASVDGVEEREASPSAVGTNAIVDATPTPECSTYGPIQGVEDPGYCEATMDMKAAYRDCLVAADELAYSFAPGSDDYWMLAKQTWNLSSPSGYPKDDETLWACLFAYQVVAEEFPGPYS